jgi:hypothetical protein
MTNEPTTTEAESTPLDALDDSAQPASDDADIPVADEGEAPAEAAAEQAEKPPAEKKEKPPTPAEFVAIRKARQAADRAAREAEVKLRALEERSKQIEAREREAESIATDPLNALQAIARREGKSVAEVVEALNAKLRAAHDPAARVDELEKRLRERDERLERERKERDEREQSTAVERQRAEALDAFVAPLEDEAAYPEIARMSTAWIRGQVAELAWGEPAARFRKEFGRGPTDDEIKEALALRVRAVYRDNGRSQKTATDRDRATEAVEAVKREQATRRAPPSLGNDRASSRSAKPAGKDGRALRDYELAALED